MGTLGTRVATLLRTHTWALNLLFIALGAYFVAGAANSVLARSIRVVPTLEGSAAAHRAPALSQHVPQEFTRIAERNLFGVKRENLNPVATEASAEAVMPDSYTESSLKPCSLSNANVRATMVAEGAPEWSMAVVAVNNEPSVFSTLEGRNQISDDAKLVEIRQRAIVVRRRDHFELCSCDEDKPTYAAVAPMPAGGGDVPTDTGGVVKNSETSFTIARAEVDNAFNNLSEVATQARIVPSFKNGKPNGFKLFSIKPGSIYSKIGLQNGDVIQKINGYEMSGPDKALEVYQKLKDASNVSIELQRRGQPMSMSYSIGG
jgi:general secretion pathway protein C